MRRMKKLEIEQYTILQHCTVEYHWGGGYDIISYNNRKIDLSAITDYINNVLAELNINLVLTDDRLVYLAQNWQAWLDDCYLQVNDTNQEFHPTEKRKYENCDSAVLSFMSLDNEDEEV